MTNLVFNNHEFQEGLSNHLIKVVAPSSGCSPEIIDKLRLLPGLNIEIPNNLIEPSIIFHANSDEERFNQLKNALYDTPEQTIIWTLRGGYGSARLIDKLNELPAPKQEKIFIGFSDSTALHLFFSQKWHWKTLHAAGLSQILDLTKDPQNYLRISEIVAKKKTIQTLNNLKPLNKNAHETHLVNGLLTGGNLTLVESSIGTSWQIQTAGKILFLEEIGEKGYRIDRSLNHLRQAGLFNDVPAIVLGDFNDGPVDNDILIALERFAKDIHLPVFQTNQFGHGKINYPLIYNAISEITRMHQQVDYSLHMTL